MLNGSDGMGNKRTQGPEAVACRPPPWWSARSSPKQPLDHGPRRSLLFPGGQKPWAGSGTESAGLPMKPHRAAGDRHRRSPGSQPQTGLRGSDRPFLTGGQSHGGSPAPGSHPTLLALPHAIEGAAGDGESRPPAHRRLPEPICCSRAAHTPKPSSGAEGGQAVPPPCRHRAPLDRGLPSPPLAQPRPSTSWAPAVHFHLVPGLHCTCGSSWLCQLCQPC